MTHSGDKNPRPTITDPEIAGWLASRNALIQKEKRKARRRLWFVWFLVGLALGVAICKIF